MSGYTKLFSEIIMSTVWREPDHVRLLWITMLALKDRWHVVHASIPGLADAARISIKQCQDAIKILSEPDPYSRSTEHEGRRIEAIDGGWLILNGEKYRNRMSLDDRREYKRQKQREYRARDKQQQESALNSCGQSGAQLTHTDTDTDTEEKPKKKTMSSMALDVFVFWQQIMGHPKAVFDPARKRSIINALKMGYSIDDLKTAIEGCAATPHNMGQNDRNQRYDGIQLIFRNADQIERFIGNVENNKQSTEADRLKARINEIRAAHASGKRLFSARTGKELVLDWPLLWHGDKSIPLSTFLKEGNEIWVQA